MKCLLAVAIVLIYHEYRQIKPLCPTFLRNAITYVVENVRVYDEMQQLPCLPLGIMSIGTSVFAGAGGLYSIDGTFAHQIPTAAPSSSEVQDESKGVIGMLFIEQIYEPNDIASDYVKCLTCKRGRLCDKPVGEKVMAIAIRGDIPKKTTNRIILKCPKCGQKFLVSFPSE